MRGFFVVLDGPDGSGKTTQAHRTVEFFEQCGHPVLHLREPGATAVGERIREILLDPAHDDMCAETETLLYLAARIQLVRCEILPALDKGTSVVCERFMYSTVAYQGAHGVLDEKDIWALWRRIAPEVEPDLVLLLDVDPEVGLRRLRGERDRMEAMGEEFHRRVCANYRRMARELGGLAVAIDASQSADDVQAKIREVVRERLFDAAARVREGG